MASSSKQSWQLGDAGILRKKEDEDELLVFGYSCKLFRDDEKALFIDQGKHLIPWMGDETLKIDRYDGRGALYDLKQYEPLPGGYDESLWVGLSDSERHVEQLCNEERYRALHHNEDEEALYQEEELKRLHQALDAKAYGEVGFNYDQGSSGMKTEAGAEGENAAKEEDDDGDEPFTAPPELDIPVNMALPETVKLNAIIEKTALFISTQGAQMEILLKMKQANNPQFQFLSYNSPLHPYYRHLQMAIKTGRYQPKPEEKEKPTDENDHEEDVEDDHYLHPSLAPSNSKVELAPSIPSIAYKPSANCAYSMLVNRIKDKQAAFSVRPPGTADAVVENPVQAPQQIIQKSSVPKLTPLVIEATPVLYQNPATEENGTVKASLKQKMIAETSDTVQKSVSSSHAPRKIFTPVKDTPKHVDYTPQNVAYGSVEGNVQSNLVTNTATVHLIGHGSAMVSTSFLTPPSDVQLIIDKMASYVAKNGREFETIVRNKGDTRFAFLEVKHQYYPYYLHKVDVYEQLEKPAKPISQPVATAVTEPKKEESELSSESEEDVENSREGSQQSVEGDEEESQSLSTKPAVAPVCFSIKKPKEADPPLDKKSALPVEESTDEEEETKDGNEEVKIVDTVIVKHEEEVIDLTGDNVVSTTEETEEREGKDKGRRERKKERPAEEKVKDKLAAAAREKVAAKARERQLQMERKKRAAAFLTMLRKTPGDVPVHSSRSQEDASRVSGDEDEISSIPSSLSSGSESQEPSQEVNERLKANGGPNPLLARIQGGQNVAKRTHRSSSSDNDHPRVKKKSKVKEKKRKSQKRERTSTPSRSHKHRKEDHNKHRKEDDPRKSKKSKKELRSKSPSKGHRSRSYHHTDRATSKSKPPREHRSKKSSSKRQKKDRKSSTSEFST